MRRIRDGIAGINGPFHGGCSPAVTPAEKGARGQGFLCLALKGGLCGLPISKEGPQGPLTTGRRVRALQNLHPAIATRRGESPVLSVCAAYIVLLDDTCPPRAETRIQTGLWWPATI